MRAAASACALDNRAQHDEVVQCAIQQGCCARCSGEFDIGLVDDDQCAIMQGLHDAAAHHGERHQTAARIVWRARRRVSRVRRCDCREQRVDVERKIRAQGNFDDRGALYGRADQAYIPKVGGLIAIASLSGAAEAADQQVDRLIAAAADQHLLQLSHAVEFRQACRQCAWLRIGIAVQALRSFGIRPTTAGDSFALSSTLPLPASMRAEEYGVSARISARARSIADAHAWSPLAGPQTQRDCAFVRVQACSARASDRGARAGSRRDPTSSIPAP